MAGDKSVSDRIETHPFPRGRVQAEWRNQGWTLRHAATGALVARLRPTGRDDRVEILYRGYQGRWLASGPFGRTILPLDQALDAIAHEPVFWSWLRS